MGHQKLPIAVALLLALLGVAAVQHIQGPLNKPDGICAQFVLPQGLGYTCEEYVVQTVDGFLLGVQRMYHGAQGTSTVKKPIFLYHGILQSGSSWLLNQPSETLPFMLGDAGYDVWIGNSRTTQYSSGHVTLQRTDEGFWNWSLDELAAFDLPAMLAVVSSRTSSTIHYIGYSQGSQSAIAAFSEGELIPLLDKVVLLAPAAYCNSISALLAVGSDLFLIDEGSTSLIRMSKPPSELISLRSFVDVFRMAGHTHLESFEKFCELSRQTVIDFMDRLCSSPDTNCKDTDLITAVAGPNCCMNNSRLSYYNEYGESTATKNIVHLAQQYRTQSFAKYDYGFLQNLQVYNSLFPPSYVVSSIPSMPLLLMHGGNDGLADVHDVALLLERLQFTPTIVFLPNYGHIDFVIGSTANVDCYSKVLTFLTT